MSQELDTAIMRECFVQGLYSIDRESEFSPVNLFRKVAFKAGDPDPFGELTTVEFKEWYEKRLAFEAKLDSPNYIDGLKAAAEKAFPVKP
jgi:hypothetical protein